MAVAQAAAVAAACPKILCREEFGEGEPIRESSERSEVLWPRRPLSELADVTTFIACRCGNPLELLTARYAETVANLESERSRLAA